MNAPEEFHWWHRRLQERIHRSTEREIMKSKNKGFTFIELFIVVAIIGIVASIVIGVSVNGWEYHSQKCIGSYMFVVDNINNTSTQIIGENGPVRCQ